MAILTDPGRDRPYTTFAWALSTDAADMTFRAGDAPDGFRWDEARRQLSDFIRLVVAYRMTGRGTARQPERAVPHIPASALATDRNWRQKRKKFSVFRVVEMSAPADRFGRPGARGTGGWTLGWRSSVHGHFKLQPHGPKASLRKLIWVEGYERGPEAAPRKSAIEVVR